MLTSLINRFWKTASLPAHNAGASLALPSAEIEVICREIKAGEKVHSNRNLLIIGDVGINANISAKGCIMLAKVEDDDLLTLGHTPPEVTLNAGRDIFIHGAGPSCAITAGGQIFAGTKIIGTLSDDQVIDIDYHDFYRELQAENNFRFGARWTYQTAGGIGPNTRVTAGGDLYADNIADGCILNVKGQVTTLHRGAYAYDGDNIPDWWPDVTRAKQKPAQRNIRLAGLIGGPR